jgi:sec-independent protein translocase protein TatC
VARRRLKPARFDERMTLVEHLAEFRSRFLRALAALVAGAVIGFVVFPWVLEILVQPYCTANEILRPGRPCNLVALRPLEPFSVRIKTSLMIGLFVGGPVIFYQLWRFITPGLKPSER